MVTFAALLVILFVVLSLGQGLWDMAVGIATMLLPVFFAAAFIGAGWALILALR